MHKERAITYSLLSHIRNNGDLAKGPIDIFIPLIKRTLSKLNMEGVFKGESVLEIQKKSCDLYQIEFPIPVLIKILEHISLEINTDEIEHFILYKDGAFALNKYSFTDFEDLIQTQTNEVDELEKLFKTFCDSSELEIKKSDSIFKFIEKKKFTLSKYISHRQEVNGLDYTIEAQFIDFFKKFPSVYENIKNIYIGSIISGYIEYDSDDAERDITLLLDTNFLVGLIDLNTPESTHTCNTLLNIAKRQKFKIQVLKETIEETTHLLEAKARYFDKSFLQKKINAEDVYNACDRRDLSRTDLERIADNLEKTISKFGITILFGTDKLKNEAKHTKLYKTFLEFRNSKKSALHDATAILYINKQRKKKIKEFDKVNAWFVNNSSSVVGDSIFLKNGFQPETIKADDLLNILWLSNPQVNKSINGVDLAEIGLTSTISLTLSKNLPTSKIIRELDDNIHKYAKEEISDTDIVRVATRITNKQLKDIEKLNSLAINNKVEFVKQLEEEALKQKIIEEKRIQKLKQVFNNLSKKTEQLEITKKKYQERSKNIDSIIESKSQTDNEVIELKEKLIIEQNKNRKVLRENWIKREIYLWRKRTWIEFTIIILILISGLLYILNTLDWDISKTIERFKTLQTNILISDSVSLLFFILTTVTIKTLFGKYRNHSNIENFKKGLSIPDDITELTKPSS
ncbi:hypothetical protein [Tenacibaculum finnmarkense]|uniref:hypothetical protein n=1 Tax=Tenacibaculum finnmarkense TaxID=2781243 RepID=UPI001EFB7936|nr:hypothetical protein [Tenacibaculum finnmarkense]MCG8206489.1 hypothetical protein [Tenacibaculum finnmarkense genomovar finnmarkense]MCG8722533.1 hypothetical protein [Tenacibaculum finnmarkense]MCG8740857.1 hypothetical protein [Tenacibaculum finnmarkense]MCG8764252.1 hypothetical protein [Tenacibaculum finnmarkense]MCG8777173.1 hypothetical protein [Tenacibaculum finnmarkense]